MAGRVAQVAVDLPHPHLDRPFDYAVPPELDRDLAAGCRVRVRFAGRLTGGYVLARVDRPGTDRELVAIARLVSAEPVLAPEVARLARAVADRMGGTLADVLRLAVPPRHARVEAEPAPPAAAPPPAPAPGSWTRYPAGPTFLAALARGEPARAVWPALPSSDWAAELAAAVTATLSAGRGAVVVAPDLGELGRLDAAMLAALGPGRHVLLRAGLGPAERYRRFLALRRGAVRAVVGSRAAAFAPVADLGLVAAWDDGADLLDEPRAPYPNARDVLVLRAHLAGAGALVGGLAPSVEAHGLLTSGWARELGADRATVRRLAPRVRPAGDDAELARDPAARAARLPSLAWETVRRGLASGPVLVQVPRRGYQPALACQDCRAPARCPHCAGPLGLAGRTEAPGCRWCGRPAGGWRCPACGSDRLRATAVGARRTAEELGRSFPRVPVRTSGRDVILAEVAAEPALVVATPGAEPVAPGGYAAGVLLDGWMLLTRPGLRAAEEALRRWANAAALVRPGGPVVLLADAGAPAVQALLRWDPIGHAAREAAERAALRFPPAARLAALDGVPAGLADLLGTVELPAGAEVLGPVPVDAERERVLVRVPRRLGPALAAALKAGQAVRSARKAAHPVRVQLDPREPL